MVNNTKGRLTGLPSILIGSSALRVLSEGGAAVHPNHATSEEVALNHKLDGKPDFIRRPDAPERNSSDQVSFRFVRDIPQHRSIYQTRGNAADAYVMGGKLERPRPGAGI